MHASESTTTWEAFPQPGIVCEEEMLWQGGMVSQVRERCREQSSPRLPLESWLGEPLLRGLSVTRLFLASSLGLLMSEESGEVRRLSRLSSPAYLQTTLVRPTNRHPLKQPTQPVIQLKDESDMDTSISRFWIGTAQNLFFERDLVWHCKVTQMYKVRTAKLLTACYIVILQSA